MLRKREFIIVAHHKKDVIVKNLSAKKNIVNVLMLEFHAQMSVNVLTVLIKISKVVIDKDKNNLKL